ncbi:MAG: phosphate/phosphite/phosphonate ABC transporter substrate-binding protein [bacterium]|nr:phosphate/phosphite/phosphonate ABC transporter substrate-binding protein [bacterium]
MKSMAEKSVLVMLAFWLILITLSLTGCPAQNPPPPDNTDSGTPGNTETLDNAAMDPMEGMPDGPVRIAFVPSVEAGAIETQLEAFDAKVSELLGHPVESSVVLSYTACIEQMAAGHFEVAMLPSSAYIMAHDRYDVQVRLKAVRNGSPTYRGQIITRTDSGINTLQDLIGRTFGFTDAASTSGHLYPKTLMIENGIDPDKDLAETTFIGSHQAVVLAVLNGRVDAGATYDDARDRLLETEPTVMEQTKVIAYTADIPSDTVSLRADCTGPFYDKLIEVLMTISKEGTDSPFYAIYDIEELVPAQDSDYDPIRRMVETLNYDIEADLN